MKGLTGIGWQIHDHLKEHRPEMFQELKAEGRLMSTVERMQNQAKERMINLEESGLHHDQAWELVKDDVLLPSEEDLVETLKP